MPDKKLEEIINRILQVIKPDKIILFGSRARGEASPESDYDLLIIKNDLEDEINTTKLIYKKLLGLNVKVDIIVQNNQGILRNKQRFISVVKDALEDGLVVYE